MDYIPGVKIIPSPRIIDPRGSFLNFTSNSKAVEFGLPEFESVSISENTLSGTLRGIHIQRFPFSQEKLIRCMSGSIYDVFLDLRKESNAYLSWSSIVLTSNEDHSLFLPKGVAHGYQTLEDNTILMYGLTSTYNSEADIHIDPNDKVLGINWPLTITAISDYDMNALPILEVVRDFKW
jgi:dTDP-4-dehydrorhamnose 3,5-epimerase